MESTLETPGVCQPGQHRGYHVGFDGDHRIGSGERPGSDRHRRVLGAEQRPPLFDRLDHM